LETEIKDALLEHFFRPRMLSGTSYITSDTNHFFNRQNIIDGKFG